MTIGDIQMQSRCDKCGEQLHMREWLLMRAICDKCAETADKPRGNEPK